MCLQEMQELDVTFKIYSLFPRDQYFIAFWRIIYQSCILQDFAEILRCLVSILQISTYSKLRKMLSFLPVDLDIVC